MWKQVKEIILIVLFAVVFFVLLAPITTYQLVTNLIK